MRAPIVSLALVAMVGAGAPTSVNAAPVKIADGWLVDATSDGRYLLTTGVNASTGVRTNETFVIDRTTSQQWPAGTEFDTAMLPQIADRSPRVLLQRAGRLVVLDVTTGKAEAADLGPDGKPVSYGRVRLVNDGTEVIFSTNEPTRRILARDLTTGTTTVRMTGVEFRDASEDGRVITYLRSLPTEQRPAGSPSSGDNLPESGLEAQAIGYQVAGQAPRWVARTVYSQRAYLANGALCTGRESGDGDGQPGDLQVTQAGDQRYTLITSTGTVYSPQSKIERLAADGSRPQQLGGVYLLARYTDVRLDAGSTAVAATAVSGPGTFGQTVTADDGTTRPIPSSTDIVQDASWLTPVDRGRTVLFTGSGADGRALGTFADEGPPVGATQTGPLLTLPRTTDPVDTDALRADASWARCPEASTPPAAGKLSQYASVVVRTRGSSAGRVTVRLAPTGVTAAKQVRLTLRRRGHLIWSRTITSSRRVTLPRIRAGKPGYTLRIRATLADGKVLTSTTALRRTQ